MAKSSIGALLQKARKIIAAEGLLVVSTGADADIVPAAYTVGLTTKLGYEVFVIGLPPQVGQQILNTVAKRLLAAEEPDDTPLTGIANMPVKLHFLPASATDDTTGRLRMIPAVGYEPQRIRQLIYPDAQGRFPGEPGYEAPFEQTLEAAGI